MSNNPPEVYTADYFLEKILAIPSYAAHLPVTDVRSGASTETTSLNSASDISQIQQKKQLFPLGLILDNCRADVSNVEGFAVKSLRRERISERIKALQQLIPSCSKTYRAAMLDEILDYVKFLRLQVKGTEHEQAGRS